MTDPLDIWPTLMISPPTRIGRINTWAGVQWSGSGSCRARISFGNIYNSHSRGIPIDHKALMIVDCFLAEGHEGPHAASLDTLDSPNTDCGSISDKKFSLTWED